MVLTDGLRQGDRLADRQTDRQTDSKQPKCRAKGKRAKITKQGVQFGNNIDDGFDIGGFKTNRVCEFEVDILNYNMSLEIKVKST